MMLMITLLRRLILQSEANSFFDSLLVLDELMKQLWHHVLFPNGTMVHFKSTTASPMPLTGFFSIVTVAKANGRCII